MVGVAGVGFTTIIMAVLVPVSELAQVALDVTIQVTISPFASDVLVYVVPPVPALLPFSCH